MFSMISILIDVASAFLAVLPFLILLEILARKQIGDLPLKHTIADAVLCFFMAAILSVTGIPGIYEFHLSVNMNFVPFTDVFSNTLQYIENIILFLPVGFLLPLLFPAFQKLHRCVLYGFGFSLVIEILQLFSFRATDVDDLLMNTLGAVTGFGIFSLLKKLYPPIARDFSLPDACQKAHPSLRLEPALLTGAALAAALLLVPAVKELIWEIFL